MSHNTIANYYMTMSALQLHHNYNIDTVENMMPYERDIYVDLLIDYLEKEKNELEKG